MLMVHPRLFFSNEQNERMNKWAKWTNEQINKHFYSFKKMSKHFYYKMSKMSKWVNEYNASKWAKSPYEQIWCQMSTWNSNLLQKYPWVYHAHGTPGCTMSELHITQIDAPSFSNCTLNKKNATYLFICLIIRGVHKYPNWSIWSGFSDIWSDFLTFEYPKYGKFSDIYGYPLWNFRSHLKISDVPT